MLYNSASKYSWSICVSWRTSNLNLHANTINLQLDADLPSPVNGNGYGRPSIDDTTMGNIFIGAELCGPKWGIPQIGFGFYQNKTTSVDGAVYNFMNPEYHNSDYKYKIKSQLFLAEGKWLYKLFPRVYPYVWGALGVAHNKAYDYKQDALISSEAPATFFADHSENKFSWGAGAGVDLEIDSALRIGVSYRYFDMGKVELGTDSTQTTNEVLSYSDFTSNAFLLQLSLLFP